jgi:nitrate reductase NapD
MVEPINHSRRIPAMLHVSSVIVTARPEHCAGLARRIADIPGAEVRHVEGSRIIVVIEAGGSDAITDRLAEVASMEGTLSANLVFEHAEPLESLEEHP